jgi:hypothetical protein
MVEPLSPMALPRRVSGGVFGFTAVSPTGYGAFKLPIDWGQSIYTAQRDSVTGYHGRAIVPNGSTATRQRRRLRFYGCFLQATKLSANASRRSIGGNRSTLPNVPAARATMVEPLSPMALPRRASGGVFGFTAVSPTGYGAFKLPIDWGQSIYTAQRDSVKGSLGRAIVPNGSTATRQRRRLRFYGCFLPPATLPSSSDRLGTIDLHCPTR